MSDLMQGIKEDFTHYEDSHLFADQANYIWLVKFITGYVVEEYLGRKMDKEDASFDIGYISSTCQLADFKQVAGFCSLYLDEKNWANLPSAVGAMKEMVLQLFLFYNYSVSYGSCSWYLS
jgi:hypothetical protein